MHIESEQADRIADELTDEQYRDGSVEFPDTRDLLPTNAHKDQENVPHGYYRAWNGRIRKMRVDWAPKVARIEPSFDDMRRSRKFTPEFLKAQYESKENRAFTGNHTYMIPTGEDVIIKLDRFRDEATCKGCRGSGTSDRVCLHCGGVGKIYVDGNGSADRRAFSDKSGMSQIDCMPCRASSYDSPYPRSTGKEPCEFCRGTGQAVGASGIAIANTFEVEPTTGVILTVGPLCRRFVLGDRVMFDQYAGKEYKFEDRKYRVMRETYPIARIVGDEDVHVQQTAMPQ